MRASYPSRQDTFVLSVLEEVPSSTLNVLRSLPNYDSFYVGSLPFSEKVPVCLLCTVSVLFFIFYLLLQVVGQSCLLDLTSPSSPDPHHVFTVYPIRSSFPWSPYPESFDETLSRQDPPTHETK